MEKPSCAKLVAHWNCEGSFCQGVTGKWDICVYSSICQKKPRQASFDRGISKQWSGSMSVSLSNSLSMGREVSRNADSPLSTPLCSDHWNQNLKLEYAQSSLTKFQLQHPSCFTDEETIPVRSRAFHKVPLARPGWSQTENSHSKHTFPWFLLSSPQLH